ncbi:tetratricopeptide repeat protein [Coleofasciculus sp. FACHB-64]|uniref:serine/threonine-protein kinase n=1 Tax=Cyanophyceae TaxID=3028117 RepID=UPI001689E173|nr:serine/threonine-protein kinase [Coleofasciculus sp. FACHB-64]MBD2047932.1 tetratricopeptide repeat protein [Coleofasciculus sp. FACHB-64]
MNLVIGQTLGGHYQIINSLGGGGFGQTYLAQDMYLPGTPRCVVKLLKPQATDPQTLQTARRLFETEAKVLHQLGNHDRIPRLFAYFEENQEFYLVQEFIEGSDLSQELPTGGSSGVIPPLSEDEVISLLQEILEILEFVHQQNVIHRDINPRNLIRRKEDNKLVLIDFGAVKRISTQIIKGAKTSFTVAIGTPGYLPSEQANGNPKLSSDIYAVGMIGIQALTGLFPNELPEDSNTGEIIWRNHSSVSTTLANVLDKMVRYDFRQRYQSAAEALQALKDLKIPTGVTMMVAPSVKSPVRPTSQKKSKKSRSLPWKILISTIVLVLGTGATIFTVNIINSSNATDLYNRGKTFSELNRNEEALNAYDKALKIRPEYLEAWNGRGQILFNLNKYKEAIEAYDKAIQISPESFEAWAGRGYVLDKLEQYKEAIDSFEKALTINPNSPEVWNGRGEAMTNLQQYQEAIESFDKAVQFKPDYYQAWYSRGWTLHNLQKYEEAIASYDKAVESKSDYSQAWYNRGNSLMSLQRYQDAIESYDKAVRFQPNHFKAWYSRGNALVNLQQYKDAIDSYTQVTKIQPNYSKGWYGIGWSLHQLQRYEEAIASYNQALKFNRGDYLIWYNRGNLLYNLKQYQEAIASYNRAVAIKPDHYESWFSRGNALLNVKRYEEAIASYDKAIRYKPDYQQAIEGKQRSQDQLKQEKEKLAQRSGGESVKPEKPKREKKK